MAAVTLTLAGQTLQLLPERAAYWEEADTLLVADPHFGKGAAFRSAGVPVPAGTTAENLSRLDVLLGRCDARRILFLGDFLHAKEGRSPRTFEAIAAWRERHVGREVVLIRGNHDRHAGDPPDSLKIQCFDEPVLEGALALAHRPSPIDGRPFVAGHIHPAVRLVGRGRQRKRLPCFWATPEGLVLPAFGDFTGAGFVEPESRDRVFVIAGDEVVEVR